MQQIWITRAGPPEVLQVKEAADPTPKAGEGSLLSFAEGRPRRCCIKKIVCTDEVVFCIFKTKPWGVWVGL